MAEIRDAPSPAPAAAEPASTPEPSNAESPQKVSVYDFQGFERFKETLLRDKAQIELGSTRYRGNLCIDKLRFDLCSNVIAQFESRYPRMGILANFSVLFNCHAYPEKLTACVGEPISLGYGEQACLSVLDWYSRSAHIGEGREEEFILDACGEWPMVRGWFARRRNQKTVENYERRIDFDPETGDLLEKKYYKSVTEETDRPLESILTEFISYCEDRGENGRPLYPLFLMLARIFRAFCAASADPERGGSAMKRIKTLGRNALKDEKLEQTMQIMLCGPDPVKQPEEYKDLMWLAANYFFTSDRKIGHVTVSDEKVLAIKEELDEMMELWGEAAELQEERVVAETPQRFVQCGNGRESQAANIWTGDAAIVREKRSGNAPKKPVYEMNRDELAHAVKTLAVDAGFESGRGRMVIRARVITDASELGSGMGQQRY